MTQPYLIALDLDGTLLTDNKKISKKTKKVLFKLMEKGHHVCISTGRPYRSSTMYYEELKLNSPIVNFNGAFVHHPHDAKFGIHHEPLELDVAKRIIKACESFHVKNIMVEVLDDVYLKKHDEVIVNTFIMDENPLHIGDLHKTLTENPTAILVHPEDHHISDLRSMLEKEHAEVIDQRVWAAPWNIIEVIRSGINKARGLEKVAAYYNIPQDRIIAFGDEDNDFEMIEYAGHGVAMGNAIDELKERANYVTLTNEEDGVAHYLTEVLALL
ncbi:Cof-type HAD-IIB family hydrolase [Fictibacillus barbaricus]|uniref:Cof subfamily protein (Haloacid dehalogenase superfamily) n=1 Tax=Fictibacillus barbaricus TaxID=182136 RepID=A0ABU1TXP5_9BACL|nr:Cof-type HAD-IIB family hydrolase [Fictibacillus barbaricus]MDR7071989.1 Cof subfamily protein (haloacid dehalogenase superfamily) [Fictibacillus barbaricus]